MIKVWLEYQILKEKEQKMTQFTTKDIALKLNVGDVEAYGFVKVLLKLGIVKQDGTRKSSKGKGKPTNLYSFNPHLLIVQFRLVSFLPATKS